MCLGILTSIGSKLSNNIVTLVFSTKNKREFSSIWFLFKDICSKEVISQLFKGVGNLYSDKKLDALTLQKQVTSKAGVTEAGIESFKQQKLDQIIEKSLKSALIREKELGK